MSIEDIARTRMKNTGESFEIAMQYVRAAYGIVQKEIELAPDGWELKWLELPPPDEKLLEESRIWILSRPPVIQKMILMFPPSCVVRSRSGCFHQVPARGKNAVVVSYSEGGVVGVIPFPGSTLLAHCYPGELEVVAYWRVNTPERMKEILFHG